MKQVILILTICAMSVAGSAEPSSYQEPKGNHSQLEEVKALDEAIEKLKELKRKELASATWSQNQGDRLQFRSENLMDAKRHWKRADRSREMAEKVQDQIDQLEERKKEILEKKEISYNAPSYDT